MAIYYYSEDIKKPKLKYKLISIWLNTYILYQGFVLGRINYIFCKDDYLKEINIKFLKHDFFTDIVTFDNTIGSKLDAEIYISMERVLDNAIDFGCSFEDEFLRVIIHGVLHLMGISDSSDEDKVNMRTIEEECIIVYKRLQNEFFKRI